MTKALTFQWQEAKRAGRTVFLVRICVLKVLAGLTATMLMQPTPSQPSRHAGQESDSWQPIPFNATDWQRDGAPTYRIEDGVLVFDGDGRGR